MEGWIARFYPWGIEDCWCVGSADKQGVMVKNLLIQTRERVEELAKAAGLILVKPCPARMQELHLGHTDHIFMKRKKRN